MVLINNNSFGDASLGFFHEILENKKENKRMDMPL
jgi:hypothetical protein